MTKRGLVWLALVTLGCRLPPTAAHYPLTIPIPLVASCYRTVASRARSGRTAVAPRQRPRCEENQRFRFTSPGNQLREGDQEWKVTERRRS